LSGDLVRLEAAAGERPARSPAVRSSSSIGAPLPTTARARLGSPQIGGPLLPAAAPQQSISG